MPNVLTGVLFSLLSLFQLAWNVSPLRKPALLPLSQSQTQAPVVHAVLYWMRGCPNCTEVLEGFLPAIQAQFGSQLDIRLVEVVTTDDVDRLFQVGLAYGLPKEKTGVPLLLLGDKALVGSQEISSGLENLVKKHLQSGGVDFPDLENLPPAPEASLSESSSKASSSNGLTLAAGMMVGMLASLVVAGWVVAKAFQGQPLTSKASWFNLAIPVLAVIGLGVAIYLTVIEITSIPAICGPIGDCNTVQQSPYSRVFGVIPVGVLGALGYLGILAAWLWGKFTSGKLAAFMPLAIFGMGIFGTLFSVYLTYLELFVIKAVCIWCLSSAVIITLLMLVSLPAASQWLAASEEDDQ
jgi:uncharacterized membrane protein